MNSETFQGLGDERFGYDVGPRDAGKLGIKAIKQRHLLLPMVMCQIAIDGETICVGFLLPDGTDCGIRCRYADMVIIDFTEILEIIMQRARRADHATRQAGNFFSLALFIGLRRGQHAVRLQRHQFLELGKTEKGMEAVTGIGGQAMASSTRISETSMVSASRRSISSGGGLTAASRCRTPRYPAPGPAAAPCGG